MSFDNVSAGNDIPRDFNVIVEIPMNADPIKYEVDKETGTLYVDRFMGTAMHYPCNYGYIPRTIADDGDPGDAKLLAVPIDKILPWYRHWLNVGDINPERLAQIQHFFEHYKDLEAGKWVKVEGWGGPEDAEREIAVGVRNYDKSTAKGKAAKNKKAKAAR